MEVGMRYKMILGKTLFSFFKKEQQGLRIKEVRFMNRDLSGEVNGTTRLLYDEDSGMLQRYVNGSAPIASLSDEMVCFLGEVYRCFGRLSGEQSWEKDVWLCVDAEVRPESSQAEHVETAEREAVYGADILPMHATDSGIKQLGMF
jgi:hypothetical protein